MSKHNSVMYQAASLSRFSLLKNLKNYNICYSIRSLATYKQGQNDPLKPKIREYFYYIDHNGMLFLDDSRMKNFTSCFKEKVFLNFFFKNVKFNQTDRYRDTFPYVSMCGIERNYIRCDDVPIVFTHIVPSDIDGQFNLVIAYSDLKYPFIPESLYMLPESISSENEDEDEGVLRHEGRIYHKADDKFGGYGLIRSTLAQDIGNCFILDSNRNPIQFRWRDNRVYNL